MNEPADPSVEVVTGDQIAAADELHRVWGLIREGKPLTESDHAQFVDGLERFYPQELGSAGSKLFNDSIRLRARDYLAMAKTDWNQARPTETWESLVQDFNASFTVIRRRLGAPSYEEWLDSPVHSAPDGKVVVHDKLSDFFWLDDPTFVLAHLP